MLNWGLIGCGTIAPAFINAIKSQKDCKLLAIASQYSNNASIYKMTYGIERKYDSYENLANDPDIDIVYIATTNQIHADNIALFLSHGKHVLCEKPITISAKLAKEVIWTAKEKKLFLMEGMWTRFLPSMVKIKKWLDAGIIGKIRCIYADFGFINEWGPERRLLNKSLCGGTLLDNGVYPISFASMIFGKQPDEIKTLTTLGFTGVDEFSSYLFKYGHDQFAVLSSSIRLETPQNATIVGEKGTIFLPEFWHCQKVVLSLKGNKQKSYYFPFKINGFEYEIETVNNCILEGKTECELMPLHESIAILETIDKIRCEWGLKYPIENI